ncbi:hypothetical protein VOLCADRAFT_102689 [Volvox carteri f. nagariensis]|uniref:Mannose-P-dolichol utilization defect 1 protein homolog n=1 Tax=Volvox carteri f. nagariensis TaxID=3068 RepID=D8THG0_VOLCA|nr:uncharacterized protein VOLCADRAFT_102689 [Volvox carteri f. nagariensis]EFJ52704.1 hypothetical protein VOLCADRAFT_102689 [Volvox carteri f. nagariensis]|eukprot:XP_002945709.1 hypothetical protein VOLCADRAFT_102689 [Volvox carteri f. nagariensis]
MADLFNTTKVVLRHVVETRSLPDVDLLKLLISQMLGYAILAGACVTKLPQILLIRQAGSAEGLSKEMFEIETYTLLVSALYGYTRQLSFNTYGESLILATQNLVILGMVYGYSRTPALRRLAVWGAYVALTVGVVTGQLSSDAMEKFAHANTVVVLFSRVPQVVKNFAAGSTGTLSGITTGINVLGCVVRIFTTLHADGGPAMLRSYIVSLVINAILLLQIIAYRKKTAEQLKAAQGQKREKLAGAESRKNK